MSGAVPPPAARPLERAARVPRPVCPGCGRCGRVDPAPAPLRAPLRAGVARCGGGGRASPGGGLFRRCEGRLVSGAVPPPAARPLERAAMVPRPVCPGCRWCGRVDPAPAPQRAPLRAGVARCGGGGRASPGGVPSTDVRGAWCRALSLPRPPVLWSGQPGFRCACVFVCVLCLAGSGGPASRARSGAPHLFLWPLCLSALLDPGSGLGLPHSLSLLLPFLVALALCFFFFFFFFSLPSRCLVGWCLPPGRWLLVGGRSPAPLPLCVPRFLSLPLGAWVLFFFFFLFFLLVLLSLCAPVVSGFLWFPAPVALGLGACLVCCVGLPLLGSPCACSSFVLSAWLLAAPSWLLPPPPPPPVSLGSRRRRSVLRAVLCCAWLGAALRRAAARCDARWCAVLCCVALVWCRCFLRRALWRCPSPWGPVLCGAVFCGVPSRCVLCAVCVLSWRGGACCCSPLCFVLCVSRGAVLCVPCALRSARCCASLCWCARVVLFVWCVPLLALWCAAVCCAVSCGVPWCGAGSVGPWLFAGGVFRCRCPCLAAWSASLWLVWFAVVPCFPVSCSVVLCCRVVLCCCSLLSFCGAVGACFALLWAVALCCVVLLVGCAVFCPVVVSARCGALSLVPWCRAAAWCRGVLSCRLVGFVSCVGVVVPTCKTAA